jgi:uncharacterized protein
LIKSIAYFEGIFIFATAYFKTFLNMKPLVPFTLPLSGLRDGTHEFRFQVGDDFFACFEETVIRHGDLEVSLTLDKRPSVIILHFTIKGFVRAECDRCLEPFDLPLEDEQDILVKYDEKPREEAEVVYIEKSTPSLDVSKFVYEFIHLALPIYKTHELAGGACDPEMLKFISKAEESETEEPPQNTIWSELKKWNDN